VPLAILCRLGAPQTDSARRARAHLPAHGWCGHDLPARRACGLRLGRARDAGYALHGRRTRPSGQTGRLSGRPVGPSKRLQRGDARRGRRLRMGVARTRAAGRRRRPLLVGSMVARVAAPRSSNVVVISYMALSDNTIHDRQHGQRDNRPGWGARSGAVARSGSLLGRYHPVFC
jgi:hypothetical protein